MRICRLDLDPVVARASNDQQVGDRDRQARRSRAPGKIVGAVPHRGGHFQFWQHTLKLTQGLFLPVAARSVPQLKPDDRRPTRASALQVLMQPAANLGIAPLTECLDPSNSCR